MATLNDAAMELNRGRCAIRDMGCQTLVPEDAFRAWRLLRDAIEDCHAAQRLIEARHPAQFGEPVSKCLVSAQDHAAHWELDKA